MRIRCCGRPLPMPVLVALIVALTWPVASPASEAPAGAPMHWVAGDLPPYAWTEGDKPAGLAYELVRVMGERMGRKVTVDFYPWARAVHLASQGGDVGLFPLARTPERENDFRWLLPLG